MTRNVVKRLASRSRVSCLFDMIRQSDMWSFDGTGNIICLDEEDCQELREDFVPLGLVCPTFCG